MIPNAYQHAIASMCRIWPSVHVRKAAQTGALVPTTNAQSMRMRSFSTRTRPKCRINPSLSDLTRATTTNLILRMNRAQKHLARVRSCSLVTCSFSVGTMSRDKSVVLMSVTSNGLARSSLTFSMAPVPIPAREVNCKSCY